MAGQLPARACVPRPRDQGQGWIKLAYYGLAPCLWTRLTLRAHTTAPSLTFL